MALWLACCASLCLKPSPWLMDKARRDLGWMPPVCHKRAIGGFTLAELLISLAILGVLATFTIPKLVMYQQNTSSNSRAKEVVAMITEAYNKHKYSSLLSASTRPHDLTQYMNYVSVDTSGVSIDRFPSDNNQVCDNTNPCLRLHNGGTLQPINSTFVQAQSNYFVAFTFDPDSVYSGSAADSAGKSIELDLFYNGQIITHGKIPAGSCWGGACGGAGTASWDPSWFSW